MKPFEGSRVALWAQQPDELAAVGQTLSRLGCRVQGVDSIEQLRQAVRGHSVDMIMARVCQCFRNSLKLLCNSNGAEALPPLVIVANALDVELYLDAMRRGAFDCVGLPLDEKELIRIASRALEARRMGLSA